MGKFHAFATGFGGTGIKYIGQKKHKQHGKPFDDFRQFPVFCQTVGKNERKIDHEKLHQNNAQQKKYGEIKALRAVNFVANHIEEAQWNGTDKAD